MVRPFVCLTILLFAAPALARPPPPPSPPPVLDEPWPAPDPKSWWEDLRPRPAEAADPLAGRKGGRTPVLGLAGAPEPLLYRLWGLPALQHQILRSGEVILEVWVRPSLSVRQTVSRVVVRQDGRAFVQARAGLACCEPEIGRRVGFDAELPAGAGGRFVRLKDDPLWTAPRDVGVVEGGASESLCVDGTSYDLILVTADRARLVRRACDDAAVGQAADVLEAVLGAAIGQEPRIDTIYPGGAGFGPEREAYRALVGGGGSLKPAHNARVRSPTEEPPPTGSADAEPKAP